MKEFLKKNYLVIILSLVHPLALTTVDRWRDVIIDHNEYLFAFVPLFHFVYGCIMYRTAKKVWAPVAIPSIVYFAFFILLYLFQYRDLLLSLILTLFVSVYPLVFALVGSLLTCLFLKSKNN